MAAKELLEQRIVQTKFSRKFVIWRQASFLLTHGTQISLMTLNMELN